MAINYRGVRFSGYNKPKRTPKHKTKSHAVLAKSGSKVKLIRFGQQGVRGAGKNPKSKGKKMSHGNSHISPDEVEWNRHTRKWQVRKK
mgnify:CR=1 FL=1